MNKRKELVLKYIYIAFGLSIIAFILGMVIMIKPEISDKEIINPVRIIGQYSENINFNDETWQEYDSSKEIITDTKSLAIKGHVQDDISLGKEVLMYIYQLDVKVLINGKIFYKGEENLGTRWDSFVSPGISENDEILIIMKPNARNFYTGSYNMLTGKLCSGTSYGLLKQQILENLWKIIISAIIFVMGLAVLVAMGGLSFLGITDLRGYLSCALLLISGAICTFIDYEYITLIFDNASMVNIVDFLSQLLICLFLIIYLKNYLITKRYIKITNILIVVWISCIVIYFMLRGIFRIYEDQMINVLMAVILIIIAMEIVFLILDFRTYNKNQTKNVLISGIALALFAVAEMVHYFITNVFWIYVFQIGLLLFTIIQFVVLLNYTKDQIEKAEKLKEVEADNLKKDAQIQKANVSIMLSQIQPHFLYNALSSIAALCEIDPKMAKNATVEFSRFLRGNMDSLAADKPIAFEQELDHTKNYLSLEQVRFPDRLKVEYDLKTTAFRLPTLTLQPIVENAVRYGVTKTRKGGTVKISAYEDDKAFYVKVEDDGAGYNPMEPKADGRTHIGISNVSDRLMRMCKGTLELESELGVGTKVLITIPKENDK